MTTQKQTFENVSSIKSGDFPLPSEFSRERQVSGISNCPTHKPLRIPNWFEGSTLEAPVVVKGLGGGNHLFLEMFLNLLY